MCWKSPTPDLWRGLVAALLAAWLASTHASPADCERPHDTLARALCSGQLTIGVRSDYPPFASLQDGVRVGYEIDLARLLAGRLGLEPIFSTVTPATRMAVLGERRVDLVIATMGHTLSRDGEARFVRPHYYQSRTVVVGERRRHVADLEAIAGRTVCVSVGNSTNAELAERGAQLMLFNGAQQLIDQLQIGACPLAAQDDSLFASHFSRPEFAARYDIKFGFSPLPWGMAVHGRDGARLAQALATTLRTLHADGTLLALASRHGIGTGFLAQEQQRWRATPCADGDAAFADPRCVSPPHDAQLMPTPFAAAVQGAEDWLQQSAGLPISLPMLKTRVALELFVEGIVFSLALVAGAVAATVGLSLGFAMGLGHRSAWVRWPMRLLLMTAQSTPLLLLMLFAGILVSHWGPMSAPVALLVAVLVLGLFNGSNGGQAIAEARAALRDAGQPAPMHAGVRHARAQLAAFAVNATRGSPAASLIGVPELLSAQTDIASFSADRVSGFAFLLIFYLAVVSIVVWLGERWLASEARHPQ